MPPILFLLDGHALAYRTYFALTAGSTSSFMTSSGEPIAGVFGFTSVLLRILEQERPDFLAVAFDTGKTFRDEIYPDYKATRAKMPEDLRPQIDRIRQLVDAFNIPRLEIPGYEADDVLGSAAHHAVAAGLAVKIITGDRDLLQLVTDRIWVSLPGRSLSDSKDYRIQDVVDLLGVRPDQVVDFKALTGDKSDNIPGVYGIGDKTAASLLQKYDTLEGVYAHLEELAAGVRKKLKGDRENAWMSRKLAQIEGNLKVALDLEQARTERFEPARVEALFRELEFRTLMSRLTGLYSLYGLSGPAHSQQLSLFETHLELSKPESSADVQWEIVDTPERLDTLVTRLNDARIISLDTETTSLDQMQAGLVGISLAVSEDKGYYIPVGHRPELGQQLPIRVVIDALKTPLLNPAIPKAGHNLKYDYVLLARHGLKVTPLTFDSMIAEWLINPGSRNLGLKNMAWVRLDFKMTEIEELIGKGKNQRSMDEVQVSEAAPYAAADAAVVLRLLPMLKDELEANQASRLLETLEMPLVTVLAEMEMRGIKLDANFLANMSNDLSGRMQEIEGNVFQSVGESFNLNSTQQLSDALFNRLGLEPPDRTRKTASGFYSTSAEVLDMLSGKHPVVDWVLEYRELSKLKSTYLDALPQQINPNTNRVHTSYNQTGSVTGRLASSDPNLQNIPIRTELGRQVRQAFVSAPGMFLLSVDYSQVELRIAAHMADDQAMLQAFQQNQDIHAATAAAIYGIPLDAVSKEQRRHAKAINFGLIYGMSPFGLTRTTDLTLAEAEDFVEAYFRQFPGVKRYLDHMRLVAAQDGYVETLLGRRRYFPGLQTQKNQMIRNREEREAINAPIQGTAADIMKLAMLHIKGALKDAGLSGQMLLQVHDELVLECPEDELHETARTVQQVMENAYQLKIPLKTEARYGKNWGLLTVLSTI
jgi:DNA polymerase-1